MIDREEARRRWAALLDNDGRRLAPSGTAWPDDRDVDAWGNVWVSHDDESPLPTPWQGYR